MKLRTLALALVALCLTVIANAHPIGKYVRHRNIATADHIYAYDGHGHDKYSRVYKPRGKDKNFYYCSGLGHHATCKHGTCHHFKVGHHQSRHACRHNCHDHGKCKPHSGSSCGHHGDEACSHNACCNDNYVHADDADEMEVETEEIHEGDSKRARIKIEEE